MNGIQECEVCGVRNEQGQHDRFQRFDLLHHEYAPLEVRDERWEAKLRELDR